MGEHMSPNSFDKKEKVTCICGRIFSNESQIYKHKDGTKLCSESCLVDYTQEKDREAFSDANQVSNTK